MICEASLAPLITQSKLGASVFLSVRIYSKLDDASGGNSPRNLPLMAETVFDDNSKLNMIFFQVEKTITNVYIVLEINLPAMAKRYFSYNRKLNSIRLDPS